MLTKLILAFLITFGLCTSAASLWLTLNGWVSLNVGIALTVFSALATLAMLIVGIKYADDL